MLALCRQQTEALVAALEDEHRRQRVEFARLYADGAAASEEAEETSVSGAAVGGAQTGSAVPLERGAARGDSLAASGGGESEEHGEETEPAVMALDAECGADAAAAGESVAAASSGYKRARVADIVEMFGGRSVRHGSSGGSGADVAAGGAGASSPSESARGAAAGAMEGVDAQGCEEQPTAESHVLQDAGEAVDADVDDAPNEGEAEQEQVAGAVTIVHAQTAAVTGDAASEDGWSTARSRRTARRPRDQRDPLPQPPPSGSRRERQARLSERVAAPTQTEVKGEQEESVDLWFSALGEMVEQVAENGPKSGASRAAYMMHLGVAEDVPLRVGRSLRGRVALLTLDGTVVAEGIGQAKLEEDAYREAYTALVVQVVRIMSDRIDLAMQSEGYEPRARKAVLDYISRRETLVERMSSEPSAEARWRALLS